MVKIHVISWNLGTRIPKKAEFEDIIEWKSLLKPLDFTPDIVVIGFQELISQYSAAFTSGYEECIYEYRGGNNGAVRQQNNFSVLQTWNRMISQKLAEFFPDADFIPFLSLRRIALGFLLFVRKTPLLKVINISPTFLGTGFSGIYGNKGVVGISMDVECVLSNGFKKQHSICLLNAHLTPHEGEYYYKERINEIDHLLHCVRFDSGNRGILDHDKAFFFGDTNFRLNKNSIKLQKGKEKKSDSDRNYVLRLVQKNDIASLLQFDELSDSFAIEKRFGFFSQFKEGLVTFLPSYKYEIMDDMQGARKKDNQILFSEKRMPAFCDRILFRGDSSEIKYYAKVISAFSDHHPVIASVEYIQATQKRDIMISKLSPYELLYCRISRFVSHSHWLIYSGIILTSAFFMYSY